MNALEASAIIGMFYYGYSPFSLVAGTPLDRFDAKPLADLVPSAPYFIR